MENTDNHSKIMERIIEIAAKKYIGLPKNREMDSEERYYNPREKEYDAFIAGAKFRSNYAFPHPIFSVEGGGMNQEKLDEFKRDWALTIRDMNPIIVLNPKSKNNGNPEKR